jgi:uncharacterized protein
VLDGAGLLSAGEKSEIAARLVSLEKRTKLQVVIATMPSLGGRAIDDVVEELGNRLGVRDGVLLLVVPKEREVRLAVGLGAMKLITNAEAHRIVSEAMVPDLHANRYGAGIVKGTDRIVAELSETIA